LAFDTAALKAVLDRLAGGQPRRYRVAFSGGLDSTVLLAAAGEAFPGHVSAIHVDHGLHPGSAVWAGRCRARCEAAGIECALARVDATPARGESPEAAARTARYAALAGLMEPGDVLLTAHQADDQLETVLIQLMRGAGVAGLAAMPPMTPFGPGELWRPLLEFPRASLAEWAGDRELDWIDDPANRDPRLARNHLRHAVLPALRAYWPSAAATAARSARHCAEAAGLLDELARIDAAGCGEGGALSVDRLHGLSRARRANLVRWQAARLGLPVPDQRRLETLLDQLETASADAHPAVSWPGAVAARHGGCLHLLPGEAMATPPGELGWPDPAVPLDLGPGLGRLSLEETDDGGLDPEALAPGRCTVRFRRGGERLRLPGRDHHSELKKLFSEAGVPPWERARTPLVMVDGELAAVGERWVASRWWRAPGNKALRVSWDRSGGFR